MQKKSDDFDLDHFLQMNHPKPKKKKFSNKEKQILRPIAEVLAILDGNAFFGVNIDDNGEDTWYEQYLPHAYSIYNSNGGKEGWVSQASWIRDTNHENESIKDAYEAWQTLKILAKKR